MKSEDKVLAKFHFVDTKFRKACQQLHLLNQSIERTEIRYERAQSASALPFRYMLRLQLATLEGIQNMYYEYACQCADKLDTLQEQLIAAGLVSPITE